MPKKQVVYNNSTHTRTVYFFLTTSLPIPELEGRGIHVADMKYLYFSPWHVSFNIILKFNLCDDTFQHFLPHKAWIWFYSILCICHTLPIYSGTRWHFYFLDLVNKGATNVLVKSSLRYSTLKFWGNILESQTRAVNGNSIFLF